MRGSAKRPAPQPGPEPARALSEEHRRRIEERMRDLRLITIYRREELKNIPWLKLVRIAAGYLEDVPALMAEITRLRGELAARGGSQ